MDKKEVLEWLDKQIELNNDLAKYESIGEVQSYLLNIRGEVPVSDARLLGKMAGIEVETRSRKWDDQYPTVSFFYYKNTKFFSINDKEDEDEDD